MVATTLKKTPVPSAAKAIGKSKAYVRSLIEAGKVKAWKIGGNDKNPWLAVDLDELRRVHEEETLYIPRAVRREQARDRRNLKLDPVSKLV